jgi:hypothetical protein
MPTRVIHEWAFLRQAIRDVAQVRNDIENFVAAARQVGCFDPHLIDPITWNRTGLPRMVLTGADETLDGTIRIGNSKDSGVRSVSSPKRALINDS